MQKIAFKSLFFSIFIILNSYCIDETSLIEHVKTSIINAKNGISKLNQDVLSLEGMSSAKVRHLLNNVCSLPNASYLEVGVWKGSTLISALLGNSDNVSNAIAIDNWSEFSGPRGIFLSNISRFLSKDSIEFYDIDCFSIDKKTVFKKPINIYFFDGNHSIESQRKAFTYFNEIFSDTFIAIVDDWNFESAEIGTKQAFKELNYEILFEEILPADFPGDCQNWWNGIYIAVVKRF